MSHAIFTKELVVTFRVILGTLLKATNMKSIYIVFTCLVWKLVILQTNGSITSKYWKVVVTCQHEIFTT